MLPANRVFHCFCTQTRLWQASCNCQTDINWSPPWDIYIRPGWLSSYPFIITYSTNASRQLCQHQQQHA
jgi:hypothetical protein